jgi:hypothetical protein
VLSFLLPRVCSPLPETPPNPLAALGGWSDADWFNPSILTDGEVVGFALPKLAGGRKQSFHVIDRTVSAAPKPDATVPVRPPKRLAGKLALLLGSFGAIRAIACCRSKFLFESGAVLFFAELKLAKLKPRPVTKLRRALIEIGLRGCLVRVDAATATAMFWPDAEEEITAFVRAAGPDCDLHPEYETPRNAGLPAKTRAPKAAARDTAREQRLLQDVAALRAQIDALQRANSVTGAMEQLGLDDARLKSMLRLLHPDKHGGSEAANDAAKWLNNLRDLLKAKQA